MVPVTGAPGAGAASPAPPGGEQSGRWSRVELPVEWKADWGKQVSGSSDSNVKWAKSACCQALCLEGVWAVCVRKIYANECWNLRKEKNLEGKFLKSSYLKIFLLLIVKQKQINHWLCVDGSLFERAELHRVTSLGSDIFRDDTLRKYSVEKKTEISLILLNSLFFLVRSGPADIAYILIFKRYEINSKLSHERQEHICLIQWSQ